VPWDYGWLSENPNITWDIIQANPDKLFNYERISYNPNITWEIVDAHPEKDWDYFGLSFNPMGAYKNPLDLCERSRTLKRTEAIKSELLATA
jgi:hypothetical protein